MTFGNDLQRIKQAGRSESRSLHCKIQLVGTAHVLLPNQFSGTLICPMFQ
jgi:hypothetical protein